MEIYTIVTAAVISALTIATMIDKLIAPKVKSWIDKKTNKIEKECNANAVMKNLCELVEELEKRIDRGEKFDNMYVKDSETLSDVQGNVEKHSLTLDALQQGVLAIIRDRLLFLIRKHMQQGFIYYTDFEILQEMYEAYQKNDGNHVITTLMQDIYKLPKKDGFEVCGKN